MTNIEIFRLNRKGYSGYLGMLMGSFYMFRVERLMRQDKTLTKIYILNKTNNKQTGLTSKTKQSETKRPKIHNTKKNTHTYLKTYTRTHGNTNASKTQ